jgi:hypothetical protein
MLFQKTLYVGPIKPDEIDFSAAGDSRGNSLMTIYKKQVAAYVAELELEPDDARRVYRHIVDNWLNPGDAETVAGEMGLI